jgi:hypothetical protein
MALAKHKYTQFSKVIAIFEIYTHTRTHTHTHTNTYTHGVHIQGCDEAVIRPL